MWVRSQDKLRLLNLNGFNYLNKNNGHKILGFDTSSDNDDMYWLLGEYSTKEKAIKALDMLQKKIIEIDKNKFLGMTEAIYKNIVFEMPQDDEVENNENSK